MGVGVETGAVSQNVTPNPLPGLQERAAQLCADDALTDEQIAAKADVTRRTLARWKVHPSFIGRVRFHRNELAEKIKAEGIANKQNRIDAYNRRWQYLEQIRQARADDEWLADVPGGKTGLVVKQLKTVKHQYIPDPDDEDGKPSSMVVEMWESAVDTGLLREWRELEKQAAQDVGQWTEKKEVTGKDGGAIEITELQVTRTVRSEAVS